jgi:hypothetical protein
MRSEARKTKTRLWRSRSQRLAAALVAALVVGCAGKPAPRTYSLGEAGQKAIPVRIKVVLYSDSVFLVNDAVIRGDTLFGRAEIGPSNNQLVQIPRERIRLMGEPRGNFFTGHMEEGTRVRVHYRDSRISGRVEATTPRSLRLAPDGAGLDPREISLSEIERLYTKERRGNYGWGSFAGLVLGYVGGTAVAIDENRELTGLESLGTAYGNIMGYPLLLGIAGGLVGGLVGWAIKTDQWVTVDGPFATPLVSFTPGPNGYGWVLGGRLHP